MLIKIDGTLYHVTEINDGYLPMIETEEGEEFYLAESSETAGEVARGYWKEMAEDDPKEFACIVGEKTLIQWGLGQWAGPGSTQVQSLEEWLDLWLDTPEETWASYDGTEREVTRVGKEIIEELGFVPTVAYRHN
jgi:hypothetical protein